MKYLITCCILIATNCTPAVFFLGRNPKTVTSCTTNRLGQLCTLSIEKHIPLTSVQHHPRMKFVDTASSSSDNPSIDIRSFKIETHAGAVPVADMVLIAIIEGTPVLITEMSIRTISIDAKPMLLTCFQSCLDSIYLMGKSKLVEILKNMIDLAQFNLNPQSPSCVHSSDRCFPMLESLARALKEVDDKSIGDVYHHRNTKTIEVILCDWEVVLQLIINGDLAIAIDHGPYNDKPSLYIGMPFDGLLLRDHEIIMKHNMLSPRRLKYAVHCTS